MTNTWQRDFFRNFEQMMASGITLTDSFELLANQETNLVRKEQLESVRKGLFSGNSLSASLRSAKMLTRFQLGMIQTGEHTGSLIKILSFLAEYLERTDRVERKIKSALIYPSFSLAACFLGLMVVPPFLMRGQLEVLKSSGRSLPFITEILILVSNLLSSWIFWVGLLVLSGVTVFLARQLESNDTLRLTTGRILLHTPFAQTYRDIGAARFARPFAMALSAGVPLEQNIRMSSVACGNALLTVQGDALLQAVKDGGTIADALATTGFFSRTFLAMTHVGEEAGKLDRMLMRAAEMLEVELEHSLERAAAMVEPLALIVMGGVVALFALGVLLPTVQLLENL